MGMQDKERIARIGSIDPGSHLGIPFSHVSAKNFLNKWKYDTRIRCGVGVGGRGGGGRVHS
jgi:hypothetical protein